MELEGVDSFVRSPTRRTLSVAIDRNGNVSVRAPVHMPLDAITRFLAEKRRWIEEKKAAALGKQQLIPVRQFIDGEEFLFKGQPYPLRFEEKSVAPIRFEHAFVIDERYRHKAKPLMLGWYELKAEQVIAARVKAYADAFGISYNRVRIVNTRSQWGSCTADGNLSFCWRLVMSPTRVIG